MAGDGTGLENRRARNRLRSSILLLSARFGSDGQPSVSSNLTASAIQTEPQTRTLLLTQMTTARAHEIVGTLTIEQVNCLQDAHFRFMAFAGLLTGYDPLDFPFVEQDRKKFAHLLLDDDRGMPTISGLHLVEFMTEVSGMSAELCAAWDYHDFHVTHGTTLEDAGSSDLQVLIGEHDVYSN